ncbi:hypothetical protein GOBAR_AA28136 [Gossypium barbadense]|uniref:Uncharacterized protein n=1 Tax=Gossypium barbadense TaxID=3634 RepID=A0A2P5WN66_GOSBA|nr:hypothetical protein GOBAR_AA28136 [Gossypium barbadense]
MRAQTTPAAWHEGRARPPVWRDTSDNAIRQAVAATLVLGTRAARGEQLTTLEDRKPRMITPTVEAAETSKRIDKVKTYHKPQRQTSHPIVPRHPA